MSGTDSRNQALDRIVRILTRETRIDSLSSVVRALESGRRTSRSVGQIAFGLDANVILLMYKHVVVSDYLTSLHTGPLILPGQAIQEFWNNRSKMQSVAEPVKSAFAQLSKVVSDLEDEHAEFQMRFQEILNDFEKEAGHIWTETFRTKVADTFHSLAERAVEPQFPKELIERLAHARQSTKTPPGFKDAGDGDLYVWAEFLLGLVEARDSGDKFELAVLITEDKKSDWGKGGEAHPILAAELFELVGVPFETWDFRKMKEYANGATAN